MHAELAISNERVIPLVFTTGPVAIAKCLENGNYSSYNYIGIAIDHGHTTQCVEIILKMVIFLQLCFPTH